MKNQAYEAARLLMTCSMWLLLGVLSSSILRAENRSPRNPQEELRRAVHDNAVASGEAAARTDRVLSYITIGAVALVLLVIVAWIVSSRNRKARAAQLSRIKIDEEEPRFD